MATLILTWGPAIRSTRSRSVPKAAQAVYDAVVALTDAFCRSRPFCDIDHSTAAHGRFG